MFGIELKSSWGIFNIVAYDKTQYSQYYKKLNSHMVILGFHFRRWKLIKLSGGNKQYS